MLMQRLSEERGLTLYKQGKVPGSFYDGRGQEAICVGAAFALGPRDRTCILHRDLGAHFVRGVTPDRYLANYMGREGGVTGGRDGNMHFGDRALGSVGMVSMLPDMAQVATGMALPSRCGRAAGGDDVLREGSTANGQWHEAMNFAGIHRLPVVFVLENNQFAYSTPNRARVRRRSGAAREELRVSGREVDGNDVEAVFEVARIAARPRPRRRRADADRGPDDADARARRARRHELRPRRSCSRSGPTATRSRTTPTADRRAWLRLGRGRGYPGVGRGVRRRVRRRSARLTDARPLDRVRGSVR